MNYTPNLFTIETFLGCNLRCPECACGRQIITRRAGYLTLEKFKIIADKIAPYVRYSFLHNCGEPLLNPDIIDIINYGQKLFPTQISTNGQNMTPEMAEQLILSGTDLCVSLDGMTQDVYEKYRVGGNLQKAIGAIDMLNAAKMKLGKNKKLQVQFIVFEHNKHQMPEFSNFCKSKNVVESFKSPALRFGSEIKNSDLPTYVRKNPESDQMKRCYDLTNVFTILLDGSVVICCIDYNGATTYGNIFEQNVLEIYNNNKINAIRNSMPIDFCIKNCNM